MKATMGLLVSPPGYRCTSGERDIAEHPDPDRLECGRPTGRGTGASRGGGTAARHVTGGVRTTHLGCIVALALAGCAPASSDVASTDALRDTLMQRIEQAYDFTATDVVEGMSALYPDTGRVISASGGYVTTSADSLRQGLAEFWENVGINMSDARWEWDAVHVDRLSEDAAVLTGTWSIPHIAPTGNPHTIRGAWTAVFRRVAGEWLIIQEHLSVPPEHPETEPLDHSEEM
jgi:ketosteroid isomerase-like protein